MFIGRNFTKRIKKCFFRRYELSNNHGNEKVETGTLLSKIQTYRCI